MPSMIDDLNAGGAGPGPDAGNSPDAVNGQDALAEIKDLVAKLTDAVAKLEADARKLTEHRRELGREQYELENIRQGLASVGTQLSRIQLPSGIADEITHLADRARVLANSKQELGKQLKGLLLDTQDVQGLEDMLAVHDAELEETKAEYRKALDGLSVCPTCDAVLSMDMKALVIDRLAKE